MCEVKTMTDAYFDRSELVAVNCVGCGRSLYHHENLVNSEVPSGEAWVVFPILPLTQARRGERGMTDSPAYGRGRSAVGT